MFLTDYVNTQIPLVLSKGHIDQQLNKLTLMMDHIFHHIPSVSPTQSSEYYSEQYRSRHKTEFEDTAIMVWLAEKISYSISLTSLDFKARLSFWGPRPTTEQHAKELYLLERALFFKTTGLGNCAKRVSYAAIELAKIFINTEAGIEVKVHSYPEIDQFVVLLGSDKDGWKVYDPLTNPEIVFDLEEYETKIKPLFRPVYAPKQGYEYTISHQAITKCESMHKKMTDFLQVEFKNLSVKDLKIDKQYLSFLQAQGIFDPKFEKTEAAIQHLSFIIHGETLSYSVP